MSLLSSLFSTAPGIGQWPLIATDISSGFQDVKKRWFNECVMAVDLGLFADKQVAVDPGSAPEKARVQVVHTALGGAAALSITGYQICCVSTVITKNGYVPKASTTDFLDLLCSRVSGAETGELAKYLRRYQAENDAETQRFRFGVDLARYITDEEPSTFLSLHVASLAERLFTLTSLVIAKAFSDQARVHKLSRQVACYTSQTQHS